MPRRQGSEGALPVNTLTYRGVLTAGLDDWVALSDIEGMTRVLNPAYTADQNFAEIISVVRALAEQGLVVLGDIPHTGAGFVAWKGTLDEQISRIEQEYKDSRDGNRNWEYFCWLKLTDLGKRRADEITPEQLAEYEDRFWD